MKIMSREFSTVEKILIFVLVFILLALFYYYFVDMNVRDAIIGYNADYETYYQQTQAMQARASHLRGIQNTLDQLEAENNLKYMASYNNSKAEVAFLNEILADTLEYSIAFSGVTRQGDQIRRSFTLQYKTASYWKAEEVIAQLIEGENRCVVGDVRCTISPDGTVTMSQAATFFETMVGGEADSALPRDSAAAR